MKLWKWLYPGIGMKRWIFLILLGIGLITVGIMLFSNSQVFILLLETKRFMENSSLILALILLVVGGVVIYYSVKQIISNISRKVTPRKSLVDTLYEHKVLEKGPNIVALGGGTGLSNLLRGLKKGTSNITGIVTVADDGGSSGKLRDELGILPPGDIRNCLVALADREPLMEELFQYRFSSEGHLVGHSFGNLFIASLTEILGDFEEAVKESSKLLAVRGKVVPA
ncbi:MAG: gluconeogenesis factor YvcK family protein, partial [Halanaerobiales bacterium]